MEYLKNSLFLDTKAWTVTIASLLLAIPTTDSQAAGYVARACGLDLNRNGIIGEVGIDDILGSGPTGRVGFTAAESKKWDYDNDGEDEDIWYVDGDNGSDVTGTGFADAPFKTIQYALSQCNGSADGEDVIVIRGICNEGVINNRDQVTDSEEGLILTESGAPTYYEVDTDGDAITDFQLPGDPMMIVGWDYDGDGEFPPYDPDDTALLDGTLHTPIPEFPGMPNYSMTFSNRINNRSHIEMAHFSVFNYGHHSVKTDDDPYGRTNESLDDHCAFFGPGRNGGVVSHLYLHDLELSHINATTSTDPADRYHTDGHNHIVYFWVGNTQLDWFAFRNISVDQWSSYAFRGRADDCGHWLIDSNTLIAANTFDKWTDKDDLSHGFKVWGRINDIRFSHNYSRGVLPADNTSNPVGGVAFGVQANVQDVIINHNIFDNWRTGPRTDVDSGANPERKVTNIHFDSNLICNPYSGTDYNIGSQNDFRGPKGIYIPNAQANVDGALGDIRVVNNMITMGGDNNVGILIDAGNTSADEPPPLLVAGNSVYRANSSSLGSAYYFGFTLAPFPRENIVFKNNIAAEDASNGYSVLLTYDPSGWDADGNIYSVDSGLRWNNTDQTSIAAWRVVSNGDTNSKEDTPLFVNPSPGQGDLHLDLLDTTAEGAGVDITGIVAFDFDRDIRNTVDAFAGADARTGSVPPEGILRLTSVSCSILEDAGIAQIGVERVGGASGVVSIDFSTADGTATSNSNPNGKGNPKKKGSDYVVNTGTLTWAAGQAGTQFIPVEVITDTTIEEDETLFLSLNNAVGGALIGNPDLATITIINDDGPGEVRFVNASYSVDEAGIEMTLEIERTGGTDGAIAVDYGTSDGTAVSNDDYSPTQGSLAWGDAEGGSRFFSVPVFEDLLLEGDETFAVSLSNVTGGAEITTPDTATVTILDNESGVQYRLDVVGGTIGGPGGPSTGVFPEGTVVYILADLPSAGEYFSQWTVAAGTDSMPRYQEEIRGYARVVLDRGDVTYQSTYSLDPRTLNFFLEASDDGFGSYPWNDPHNWATGVVPTTGQGVDIGDSPDVVRATLRTGTSAGVVEVAEFDFNRPEGNGCSLTVENTGSLTCAHLNIGKDKSGFLNLLGGNITVTTSGVVLGDSAGREPAQATVTMTGGVWDIQDGGIRMGASPGGNSYLDIRGGQVMVTKGVQIRADTTVATSVGSELHLSGTADWFHIPSFNDKFDLGEKAVLHIEGGNVSATLRPLNLLTDSSTLKYSGTGVSTVTATAVSFASGSQVDVGSLNVAPGTYVLIDGASITDSGLQLSAGSSSAWSLQVDTMNGDLLATYAP